MVWVKMLVFILFTLFPACVLIFIVFNCMFTLLRGVIEPVYSGPMCIPGLVYSICIIYIYLLSTKDYINKTIYEFTFTGV